MRIVVLLLIAIFSYAKYYSIQFVSAKRKKDAFYVLNHLRYDVRKFSFFYKTDSGFYTIRFLVSKDKKRLKRIAKKLPYKYTIVPDDYKKIKPFLSFTPKLYEEFLKELYVKRRIKKRVKIKKKVKKVKVKRVKFKKIKRFKKSIKKFKGYRLPNYIKMDVYLYEYDKDKIKKMIKLVEPYQKAAGYYKLKEYKNLEDVIFNMKNKNSQMYATYFEALKNSGNFAKSSIELKDKLFYIDFVSKKLPYLFELMSINTKAKKVVVYKVKANTKYFIGASSDSKSNEMFFKILKNIHTKPFDVALFISYKEPDLYSTLQVDSKLYFTKRDIAGIDVKYKKGRSSYQFISDFSRNFLYKYKFYRFLAQIFYSYQVHYNLFYTLYFKRVSYSNYLNSYNEIGGNIFYGDMDNMTKKWKYFLNPSFAYNDKSGLGYQLLIGANRRVIKADNLKIIAIYGKDTKELKVVYIYYY